MRKIALLSLALLTGFAGASARSLTLEEVISIAQDSTIEAYRSRCALEQSTWEYGQFLARRRPQLSFLLEPGYQKFSTEPYTHYYKLRDYNMVNTYGEFRLEQQANGIGGNYFVSTGALWTEYFGGGAAASRYFSAVPVSVGYSNSLIGYNPYKWEKVKESFKSESSRKLHEYELMTIALDAATYFIDCVVASSRYEICLSNKEVAAKMLSVGKEKFSIASISKNELFALELQFINASNNLSEAIVNMDNSRSALLSYLQIDPVSRSEEIVFEMPRLPDVKHIDAVRAVDYALGNNPEVRELQLSVILARQKVDRTKVENSFLQSSVDVSVGVQNYDPLLSKVYSERTPFVTGGVTLKIPILDGGLARSRGKAAQSALQTALASQQDGEREIELAVRQAIVKFESAQALLLSTSEAIEYADDSYKLAQELYENGEIDINTFVLAQNRKDEAYTNYLNSLSSYWTSYYTVDKLCVYSF